MEFKEMGLIVTAQHSGKRLIFASFTLESLYYKRKIRLSYEQGSIKAQMMFFSQEIMIQQEFCRLNLLLCFISNNKIATIQVKKLNSLHFCHVSFEIRMKQQRSLMACTNRPFILEAQIFIFFKAQSWHQKESYDYSTNYQDDSIYYVIQILIILNMLESESLITKEKFPEKPKEENLIVPTTNQIIEKKIEPTPAPVIKQINQEQSALHQQNKKLRRKLKELSLRLDDELQKAAQYKLKHMNQRIGHPVTLQSQNLQLQNAYKMIERLQRTVKDFQSKEAYHVTLKRVMDLQGVIKKKEDQVEQLKTQIKTQKKIVKDKERYIQQLIENSKKMGNPTEDLETINKLKLKIKKISQQCESLRRKELQKHEKLVKAERKIIELENHERQMPQLNNDSNLKQLQDCKNKYKDAIQRIQRQNIYISKLNEKLNLQNQQKTRNSEKRIVQRQSQRKNNSFSLEELPSIKKKVMHVNLQDLQLPSPTNKEKLKRY